MLRGLLVLVAVVAGGLAGLAAGPAVWSVLEDIGVVAWPVCSDVFGGAVDAMCARPRSVEVVALSTAALGAGGAGIVVWRVLGAGPAPRAGQDATD